MQEVVLKVLVFAVHVREFKNHFLVFVPTNILLSQLGKILPKPVCDIKKRILQLTNFKSRIKVKEPSKTPF